MNKTIRSLVTKIYFQYYSRLSKQERKKLLIESSQKALEHDLKVAFICDEMTWCDYSPFCSSIFLHPAIWKEQLRAFQPDILFCESAWCGIDCYLNCWRGKVYRDSRLNFENRKELIEIIGYCRENRIKSVFWNKEDPTFFGDKVYDFASTAMLFDYIYTTSVECIDKYNELCESEVAVMPFGVNLQMYRNQKTRQSNRNVVFFGSWFSDQEERCRDMEYVFDYVIRNFDSLTIYDRKSYTKNIKFKYPDKYLPFIRRAVPYDRIPELCSNFSYAVNINTVTNSKTMCSRRMLQMIACGLNVICNTSQILDTYSDFLHIERIADGISLVYGTVSEELSTEKQLEHIAFDIGIHKRIKNTETNFAYV